MDEHELGFRWDSLCSTKGVVTQSPRRDLGRKSPQQRRIQILRISELHDLGAPSKITNIIVLPGLQNHDMRVHIQDLLVRDLIAKCH